MKKIIALFLLAGISWGQSPLNKFIGEKIVAEARWLGAKVAEINITINVLPDNDSVMTVHFVAQTVGWAKSILTQVDTIYTEFNHPTGDLIKTYRFSYSNDLLNPPDTSWTYVTRQGKVMTYKYLRTAKPPFLLKIKK